MMRNKMAPGSLIFQFFSQVQYLFSSHTPEPNFSNLQQVISILEAPFLNINASQTDIIQHRGFSKVVLLYFVSTFCKLISAYNMTTEYVNGDQSNEKGRACWNICIIFDLWLQLSIIAVMFSYYEVWITYDEQSF